MKPDDVVVDLPMPSMRGRGELTKLQRKALRFIRQRTGSIEAPPTVEELARHLGLTSSTGVARTVAALTKRSLLLPSEVPEFPHRAAAAIRKGSD